MINLIVKATSKKGRKALRQGLEENTAVQTKIVKTWYEITKARERPYTLLIRIKTPLLSARVVSAQIQDTLALNGAEIEKDYTISVTEVVK